MDVPMRHGFDLRIISRRIICMNSTIFAEFTRASIDGPFTDPCVNRCPTVRHTVDSYIASL